MSYRNDGGVTTHDIKALCGHVYSKRLNGSHIGRFFKLNRLAGELCPECEAHSKASATGQGSNHA